MLAGMLHPNRALHYFILKFLLSANTQRAPAAAAGTVPTQHCASTSGSELSTVNSSAALTLITYNDKGLVATENNSQPSLSSIPLSPAGTQHV